MSSGRFSRKQAVATYFNLLEEFGAIITKKGEQQYSDFFEGKLQEKEFKFIVYHNKDGEFTKIDWQKVARDDLQDVKAFFDEMRGEISKLSEKVDAAILSQRMGKMKVKEEAGATP